MKVLGGYAMHTLTAPESLKPEEQAVVELAASNSGKIEIANRSDTRGPAVRAGRQKLYNQQDPTYAKMCCEAVSQLIELQLLRTAGGPKQYELTNFGWQLSRKLTIKAKEKSQEVSNEEPQLSAPSQDWL
jgi:hypothetical protein